MFATGRGRHLLAKQRQLGLRERTRLCRCQSACRVQRGGRERRSLLSQRRSFKQLALQAQLRQRQHGFRRGWRSGQRDLERRWKRDLDSPDGRIRWCLDGHGVRWHQRCHHGGFCGRLSRTRRDDLGSVSDAREPLGGWHSLQVAMATRRKCVLDRGFELNPQVLRVAPQRSTHRCSRNERA
jgi:hypothetical protein